MSAKHQDPEYRKNARLIRQSVAKRHRSGRSVTCWRCGYEIEPGQSYDVGHIHADEGHSIGNLGPEHRYKTGRCQGNRAHGGRIGAAKQAAQRQPGAVRPVSSGMLPW